MNRKPENTRKTEVIEVRVSPLDKVRIQMLANVFSNGDLSKWIRYAALHCRKRKI